MKKDLPPRLPGGAVHRQQRGGAGAYAVQRGDELGAGPREARVARGPRDDDKTVENGGYSWKNPRKNLWKNPRTT